MHRDLKPLNIIFSEADRRFKLIDLGAAADLRTGTNYVPDESILDPAYCPPEQVRTLRPETLNYECILDPTHCPPVLSKLGPAQSDLHPEP